MPTALFFEKSKGHFLASDPSARGRRWNWRCARLISRLGSIGYPHHQNPATRSRLKLCRWPLGALASHIIVRCCATANGSNLSSAAISSRLSHAVSEQRLRRKPRCSSLSGLPADMGQPSLSSGQEARLSDGGNIVFCRTKPMSTWVSHCVPRRRTQAFFL